MSDQTQTQDNAQDNSQVRQTPIETHRDGRVTAAIWANEGERGPMYNATLSYSYQDKEGDHSITVDKLIVADLPEAVGDLLTKISQQARVLWDQVKDLRGISEMAIPKLGQGRF